MTDYHQCVATRKAISGHWRQPRCPSRGTIAIGSDRYVCVQHNRFGFLAVDVDHSVSDEQHERMKRVAGGE